jgi:hypothetical protein
MPKRGIIPNLVVSQRVIDKMSAAARHYLEDETGEAMVGLVMPGTNTNGVPTIYVLDTISPDESAVRQLHTFQQGDERQDELIWWLQENWRIHREKRRESYGSAQQGKWDAPLSYLGDWHKQPGFMVAPSGGDLLTALDWLDDPDNDMDALLVPIVTLDHPATTGYSQALVNYVTTPMGEGTLLRVDWWYIHRDIRVFQPINPTIYPADQLPGLVGYPWHLVDHDRASRELGRLQKDNLFVSLLLWDIDDQLPLEICFMMARQGAERVLIIGTYLDYPDTPPVARSAPFANMGPEDDIYDVFEDLWQQSEKLSDPPGWQWTPDKMLIDYVRALEDAHGLRPAQPEAEGSDVDDDEDTDEITPESIRTGETTNTTQDATTEDDSQ